MAKPAEFTWLPVYSNVKTSHRRADVQSTDQEIWTTLFYASVILHHDVIAAKYRSDLMS